MISAYPIQRARLGGAGIDAYLLSAFDPDAAAFFTAAGITDATQKSAANQLVLDLKTASIWSKFIAIYPLIGGSASPHSFNLKNPAAFQITWGGTVTHNANGITGNGSTGYGDTGVNCLSDTTADSLAFGVYSRTSGSELGREIGTQVADPNNCGMFANFGGDGYFDNGEDAGRASGAITNALGLITSSRTASNAHAGYRNASSVATTTGAQGTRPNNTFAVLRGGSTSAAFYSSRNLAFAFISSGLTSTEVSNLYTAVQTFQTALGRQV